MGLLDEAIREHLDLKRRRGADPAEVERAEREALGPVRRNREAPVISDADADGDRLSGALAYDQAGGDDDEDWVDDEGNEPLQDGPLQERDPPALELSGDDPDAPRGRRADADFDETAFGESSFEEPAVAGDSPPATSNEESSDDMLEETPEFLQDTPDHDRLWFEQRPPKDFDFDG